MYRKAILTLVVASLIVCAAVTGSVAGAPMQSESPYAGKITGATEPATGLFGSTPDYAVTSGPGGHAEWWVTTDSTEDLDALESWAQGVDDREVLKRNNETNRSLIRAPRSHMLGGWEFDGLPSHQNGLIEKPYVAQLAIHQRVSNVEPVSLQPQNTTTPKPPFAFAAGDSEFPQQGVAYEEDTNQSTMREAKSAAGASGITADGSGVTVAVVDSGLNVDNTSNSALYQDRIVAARDFVEDESGLENVSSSNLHGSWVTSAIAADPNTSVSDEAGEGVAPDADIVAARALSDDGSGSTEDIAAAIRWSEAQGADVISLSLGSPRYSPVLVDAIEHALAGNTTLVVVATGNSRQQPGHLRYLNAPASAPTEGVIAVGATNVSDPQTAASAYFSSVAPRNGATDASRGVTNGEDVDIAAPGMRITAPVYDTSGYRLNATRSGTSMATPIASGVAALMLDANPGLVNDTEESREQLLETASPVPNAGVTEVGHGQVNASNAVTDTRPNETQASVRTTPAEQRDSGNRAYSGSSTVRFFLAVSQTGGAV